MCASMHVRVHVQVYECVFLRGDDDRPHDDQNVKHAQAISV